MNFHSAVSRLFMLMAVQQQFIVYVKHVNVRNCLKHKSTARWRISRFTQVTQFRQDIGIQDDNILHFVDLHHVMILGKWPTWRTILFYVFIFIFNSLHASSTSCSSSGCTGRTSDLHTTRSPTQSDSYQRLYWHNLSLLMMSTMCSKHAES
jgi:hypothetical protein